MESKNLVQQLSVKMLFTLKRFSVVFEHFSINEIFLVTCLVKRRK